MTAIYIVGGYFTNETACFDPAQLPIAGDTLMADSSTQEFTVTDGFNIAISLKITEYDKDINYLFDEEPRSSGQVQNESKYDIFNILTNVTRVD